MNFDQDPRDDEPLAGAEASCNETLPSLPAGASDFFRSAYAAFEARRAFQVDAVETAARVAAVLGAASGSFAAVFASGFAFGRATLLGAPNFATSTGTIGAIAELGSDPNPSSDGRTLSGVARFVMGGPVATHAVLLGEDTVAFVDLAARGVSRAPAVETAGFARIPVCAIHFDGVPITPWAGPGGDVAQRVVRNLRRTLSAAIGIGIGRHAFRLAIEHFRSLGERPSQATEFSLSDVATDLDAAELSVLRAAWGIDRASSAELESASAKLLAGRAATRSAHSALVLVGNSGYKSELSECYLDACALELQEGASATQIAAIASEMLRES